MKPTQGLRFAAHIRVSTEVQAERGESLRTQENQIRSYVKMLGGTIADDCIYSGQEHSSTGYDRPMLDALLADSTTGKFDAVMVTHVDRLGRNVQRSMAAKALLFTNGIRLFVNTTEIDRDSVEQGFTYTVLAAAAEMQSAISAQKSMDNRLELVKRGWPTSRGKPFGRKLAQTADKSQKAEWVIDPEGQDFIRRAYQIYVDEGLSFAQVGNILECSETAIRNRLMIFSGTVWQQHLKVRGINHTIDTEVPPLLTDNEIEKVKAKADVNRSWRERTRLYPLSMAIKCHCGSGLSGSTTPRKKSGRRHSYYQHNQNKGPDCMSSVPALLVETEVFYQIGQMLTQQDGLEAAVREALAGSEAETNRLDTEIAKLSRQLKVVEKEAKRIVSTITSGAAGEPGDLMFDSLQEEINGINDRSKTTKSHKHQLEWQRDLINVEIPDELGAQIRGHMAALVGKNGRSIITWPTADQKHLIELLFGQRQKELGVFVARHEHPEGGKYWSYELRGLLGAATGVITDKPNLDDTVLPKYTSEQPSGKVDAVALRKLFGGLSDQLLNRRQHSGEQFESNSGLSILGGQ